MGENKEQSVNQLRDELADQLADMLTAIVTERLHNKVIELSFYLSDRPAMMKDKIALAAAIREYFIDIANPEDKSLDVPVFATETEKNIYDAKQEIVLLCRTILTRYMDRVTEVLTDDISVLSNPPMLTNALLYAMGRSD